ncbi:MAG: shikimate kinase [Clostridium sp.]|uniref:shikimate kinase n=1 Tax=Clostridium sp. TaxID=1506 RepID=UPI0029088BD6|nr:shikimate kinase [Clostridium sp.]MDU7338175.1 shikimate kinase [Clostridium sp.]
MCGNIVLCGFMGSGKTTVGQVLAQKSGRAFFDLDQYIEQQEGKTVTQIFAEQGEEGFRKLETKAARKLSEQNNLIIATGGGAVLKEENVEILRKGGVLIHLDASLNAVEQRLNGLDDRPLLQRDDRQEFLRILYAKRIPLYRTAAHLSVNADYSPDDVCEQILQKARFFFSKNT